MIKTEYIKKAVWFTVILTNVILWSNVYLDIKLKAQRLVYQVNHLVMTDSRINKEYNKYLYSDNQITLINILTGSKTSNIYSKEFNKVKPFKRYDCKIGKNLLEYSRQDDNLYYPEEATFLHKTKINIPILAIIKTYFIETQYIVINTNINDLPLPLNVSYLTYKHSCGTFADWNVKL